MTQQKAEKAAPDGWVVWHPNPNFQDTFLWSNPEAPKKHLAEKLEDQWCPTQEGWRIRPVRLVFMDED